MNFYVYHQDFEDPEVHLFDVFVGPIPPKSHENLDLEEFSDIGDLYEFLKSAKIDQVCTFRHPSCPDDLIDGLNTWIEANLSLRPIPDQKVGDCGDRAKLELQEYAGNRESCDESL